MIQKERLLKHVLPLCFLLIGLNLLIARVLYPPDSHKFYSDVWDTISGLGDMENNPIGWIFFQIAMVISGIAIIPVAIYVQKTFVTLQKGNGIIGILFLYIGSIGFLLTGFIPDDTLPINKLHEITAGLGFGGVMFAAFFLFWASLKGLDTKIDKKTLINITILWWIPLIITIIAYAWAELVIKEQYNLGWYSIAWQEAGVSPFFSFAVWERVLYVVMFLYLWLLPKSIKNE